MFNISIFTPKHQRIIRQIYNKDGTTNKQKLSYFVHYIQAKAERIDKVTKYLNKMAIKEIKYKHKNDSKSKSDSKDKSKSDNKSKSGNENKNKNKDDNKNASNTNTDINNNTAPNITINTNINNTTNNITDTSVMSVTLDIIDKFIFELLSYSIAFESPIIKIFINALAFHPKLSLDKQFLKTFDNFFRIIELKTFKSDRLIIKLLALINNDKSFKNNKNNPYTTNTHTNTHTNTYENDINNINGTSNLYTSSDDSIDIENILFSSDDESSIEYDITIPYNTTPLTITLLDHIKGLFNSNYNIKYKLLLSSCKNYHHKINRYNFINDVDLNDNLSININDGNDSGVDRDGCGVGVDIDNNTNNNHTITNNISTTTNNQSNNNLYTNITTNTDIEYIIKRLLKTTNIINAPSFVYFYIKYNINIKYLIEYKFLHQFMLTEYLKIMKERVYDIKYLNEYINDISIDTINKYCNKYSNSNSKKGSKDRDSKDGNSKTNTNNKTNKTTTNKTTNKNKTINTDIDIENIRRGIGYILNALEYKYQTEEDNDIDIDKFTNDIILNENNTNNTPNTSKIDIRSKSTYNINMYNDIIYFISIGISIINNRVSSNINDIDISKSICSFIKIYNTLNKDGVKYNEEYNSKYKNLNKEKIKEYKEDKNINSYYLKKLNKHYRDIIDNKNNRDTTIDNLNNYYRTNNIKQYYDNDIIMDRNIIIKDIIYILECSKKNINTNVDKEYIINNVGGNVMSEVSGDKMNDVGGNVMSEMLSDNTGDNTNNNNTTNNTTKHNNNHITTNNTTNTNNNITTTIINSNTDIRYFNDNKKYINNINRNNDITMNNNINIGILIFRYTFKYLGSTNDIFYFIFKNIFKYLDNDKANAYNTEIEKILLLEILLYYKNKYYYDSNRDDRVISSMSGDRVVSSIGDVGDNNKIVSDIDNITVNTDNKDITNTNVNKDNKDTTNTTANKDNKNNEIFYDACEDINDNRDDNGGDINNNKNNTKNIDNKDIKESNNMNKDIDTKTNPTKSTNATTKTNPTEPTTSKPTTKTIKTKNNIEYSDNEVDYKFIILLFRLSLINIHKEISYNILYSIFMNKNIIFEYRNTHFMAKIRYMAVEEKDMRIIKILINECNKKIVSDDGDKEVVSDGNKSDNDKNGKSDIKDNNGNIDNNGKKSNTTSNKHATDNKHTIKPNTPDNKHTNKSNITDNKNTIEHKKDINILCIRHLFLKDYDKDIIHVSDYDRYLIDCNRSSATRLKDSNIDIDSIYNTNITYDIEKDKKYYEELYLKKFRMHEESITSTIYIDNDKNKRKTLIRLLNIFKKN